MFPGLHILYRRIDQRRDFRISFGDVSDESTWVSHVGGYFVAMDRYLFDWSAYPLDVGDTYALGHVLPVRRHVYSLYVDRLEIDARNGGKIAGRDRTILAKEECLITNDKLQIANKRLTADN